LDKYYEGIPDQTTISTSLMTLLEDSLTPLRCFFPYPTKFKEHQDGTSAKSQFIEFEYTDVPDAHPANVTFFAQVKSSNRKLVIKFVDRYGVEAHELLAKAGMAPRLLYCGLLDGDNDIRDGESRAQGRVRCGLYIGPLRMVVMDYVEAEERPMDAREKAEEAIKKLHDAGLVFGDLRTPNILFSGGKISLIDFDWAGKVGEARYPRGLSRGVKWPTEPASLERELIKTEDDIFMLGQLFSE
jgi:hypothetical protein